MIGVDLEEVARFANKPYEKNKRFYAKIFTKQEIEYCLQKGNPYPHFTVRFCAKEAVMKAFPKKWDWQEIEVIKDGNKPKLKNIPAEISLSHTKNYAVAMVLKREVK